MLNMSAPTTTGSASYNSGTDATTMIVNTADIGTSTYTINMFDNWMIQFPLTISAYPQYVNFQVLVGDNTTNFTTTISGGTLTLTYNTLNGTQQTNTASITLTSGSAVLCTMTMYSNVFSFYYGSTQIISQAITIDTYSSFFNSFVQFYCMNTSGLFAITVTQGSTSIQNIYFIGDLTYVANDIKTAGTCWGSNLIASSNVGIRVYSPAYPLDVLGDINLSGTIRSNGIPYPPITYNSNVAGYSSNFGITNSNIIYPSLTFSSNLANTNSNNLYPKAIYSSNTSTYASNFGITNSNIIYPGLLYSSNTATYASNFGITNSNIIYSTLVPSLAYSSNYVNTILSNATMSNAQYIQVSNLVVGDALAGNLTVISDQNINCFSSFYMSNSLAIDSGRKGFFTRLLCSNLVTQYGVVASNLQASNIYNSTLSNCVVPYTNLTGVPTGVSASNFWQLSGSNVYMGTGSNVGIGTNTPSAALDVIGNIKLDNAAGTFTNLISQGNWNATNCYWKLGTFQVGSGGSDVPISIDGNFSRVDGMTYIKFVAALYNYGAAETFYSEMINNTYTSGKILAYLNNGVSPNQVDIYVYASSYTMTNFTFTAGGPPYAFYPTPTWVTTAPTTSGSYILVHDTSVNSTMYKVANAIAIGAGPSAPTTAIDIYGDMSTRNGGNTGGAGGQIDFFGNSSAYSSSNAMASIKGSLVNLYPSASNEAGGLTFNTRLFQGGGSNNSNLTTRMMITHDGLVGIGTTTPSTNLNVIGNVAVSGTITAGTITNSNVTWWHYQMNANYGSSGVSGYYNVPSGYYTLTNSFNSPGGIIYGSSYLLIPSSGIYTIAGQYTYQNVSSSITNGIAFYNVTTSTYIGVNLVLGAITVSSSYTGYIASGTHVTILYYSSDSTNVVLNGGAGSYVSLTRLS